MTTSPARRARHCSPRALWVGLASGLVVALAVAVLLRSSVLASSEPKAPPDTYESSEATREPARPSATDEFEVPPPPFSDEDIFPCSECHADEETNPERRELEDAHDEIELTHDEEHRWCLDCHNPDDRDKLRLASGQLIDFTKSYLLCGQCHGDKYRDWRAGVHGKRTGSWNGKKRYLLCAHCHNPHNPRFAPIAPMPPPQRPTAKP